MANVLRALTAAVAVLGLACHAEAAGGAGPRPAEAAGEGGQIPRLTHAEATAVPVTEPVRPGTTVKTRVDVRVSPGFHVQSDKPRDPSLIPLTLTFDVPPGVTVGKLTFPPPKDFMLKGSDQPLAVFEGAFSIGVELVVAKDVGAGELIVPARLRYQACDDSVCFRPTTIPLSWTLSVGAGARGQGAGDRRQEAAAPPPLGPAAASPAPVTDAPREPTPDAASTDPLALFDQFAILGTTGGYLNKDEFLKFISDAERGVKSTGMFEGKGPLAILALVFIGGIALNLTPCVLPMIPVNLAIIGAGAQRARRGRGFLLGAVYGGAMALVYGVLGLIVILTAGTFGTINASPWFNLGIAALFVVLGLAMFDVIMVDFTRFRSSMRLGETGRGTIWLAFSMGAIAALLAGACVAPVVIQVIVFASNLHSTGTSIALALPFVLGLGMGLPWPIAGAGMASLPKPGLWMVRVKQAMGVVILATAAYYAYVAYGIFANRWVDPSAVQASVEEKVKEGWHASLAEGLLAAKQSNTPAIIDFWATWCKNCVVMDETTLKDPAVKAALDGYTKIKFQAEDPDASPAKEMMQRIGAVGLPAYVIVRPKAP
jgi:cytochrome c biogenesis protein CcdA/DsbC/DsbD-like thiol-disulfide interchange protein